MLFHVSEERGIEEFEPRAPKEGGDPVVWAIHAVRLPNYLVPRDCPRVTYSRLVVLAVSSTTRGRGLGSQLVTAVEHWTRSRGAREMPILLLAAEAARRL